MAMAGQWSREDLLRAFDLLTRAEQEVRVSEQPRYNLEMALLRLMHLRKLVPLDRADCRCRGRSLRLVRRCAQVPDASVRRSWRPLVRHAATGAPSWRPRAVAPGHATPRRAGTRHQLAPGTTRGTSHRAPHLCRPAVP